jgi:Protein of unknown function (DUF2971)
MTSYNSPSIPENLLWHYTDFGAARSIIEKGEMWASNLRFLNDTTEFTFALDRMAEIFQVPGVIPDIGVPWIGAEIFKSMLPYMDFYHEKAGIYVTCFSTEADDLNQWRGYASTPPGFAIGFDQNHLRNRVTALQFKLENCLYTDEQQESEVRKAVTEMYEEAKSVPGFAEMDAGVKIANFVPSILARHARIQFTDLAARFKSKSFEAENESRAIRRAGVSRSAPQEPVSTTQYRQSRSMVVPYLKWLLRDAPESESPIRAIIVGPGPHRDEVATVVNRMCGDNNVHARVCTSSIPYRNW